MLNVSERNRGTLQWIVILNTHYHAYQWCKMQTNKWGWLEEWMANVVHTLEEEDGFVD
mgnify:FL=1